MLKSAVSEQNSCKAFEGILMELSGNVGDGGAQEQLTGRPGAVAPTTASQQEGVASKKILAALEFPAP